MANKRYYWIRLKKDFFDSLPIKRLRQISGGDTFVIIYIKMILHSLETDGLIESKGLCDSFSGELALELNESEDNVKMTLSYLLKAGLAETEDEMQILLPYAVDNAGSEADSTRRWHEWRNRKALESNKSPTLIQQVSTSEKEKEKKYIPPFCPPEGTEPPPEPSYMPDHFVRLWELYPHDRRGDKQRAIRAWYKLQPDNKLAATICKAVARQKLTDEWQRDIGIPYLSTYLNGYWWEGWGESEEEN